MEINSIACFYSTRQTLMLSREADQFYIHIQGFSKNLSKTGIEAFKNFEHQLRALQMRGCSTVETCAIRFRTEPFQTSDGTCS